MSMFTHQQKDLLRPWAELYARLDERIANMTADERKNLYDAACAASPTNCWHATYRVAQVLKSVLRNHFGRETMKELKKADDAASNL